MRRSRPCAEHPGYPFLPQEPVPSSHVTTFLCNGGMHGDGRGHAVTRSGSHYRTGADSHFSKRGLVLLKTLL